MEFKACLLSLLKIGLYSYVLMRKCSNAAGCPSTEFQCADGQCVPNDYVCDDENDCQDSSDESRCQPIASTVCHSNEFPCVNGKCIPYVFRCDGHSDCGDYSDEECDPFLDNFLIVAEVGAASLRGLYQIYLSNGTMIPLIRNRYSKINAVAFDGNTKTVYWSDVDSGTIRRYALTSNTGKQDKTIETIYTATSLGGKLEGLALDVDNGTLYYCQSSNSTSGSPGVIGEMSLNGENRRIIVSEPEGNPRSIVLDKVNRLMYWTDWGKNPMILRAAMEDGGDRTVLVNSSIMWPNALAIDFAGDILYWGDAWFHRIESISLSGRGNRRIIVDESSTNASYFSFALSSNYLYITDRGKGKRSVRKLDLRTASVVNQSPVGVFDRLNGIVHYHNMSSVQKAKNRSASFRPPKTQSTTFKTAAQSPVGIPRRTKTASHSGASVTTTDMLSAGQAVTVEGPLSLDSGFPVTTVVAVIVVGVVMMICVIATGILVLKAKRARNRLLVDKRSVLPPVQRDINSYDYRPVSTHSGGRGRGGDGGGGGEGGSGRRDSSPSSSGDSGTPSAFASRGPVVRTSSSKPFLNEDNLALNNVYSTIAGDYENVNPYEIIDD